VINRARGFVTLVAAGVIVALAAVACGGGEQPTPIYIVTTLPSVGPTETPTPTSTEAPSESAVPSGSPSATPAGPTATPVSGGGLVGVENCTGSQTIKDFFTEVASKVTWDVYCGHLPSGWSVKPPNGLNYGLPHAGSWMTGEYLRSGGYTITIKEGAYGADICASNTGSLGTASFATMTGNFYTIAGGFAICVNPGTKTAYEISGTGMNQAAFTSIAANLALVPKP
jgi:hypothetical protein